MRDPLSVGGIGSQLADLALRSDVVVSNKVYFVTSVRTAESDNIKCG